MSVRSWSVQSRRALVRMAIPTLCLPISLSVAGCQPPETSALAVVLGARSNVKLVGYAGSPVEKLARQVADSGGQITIVVADGTPTVDYTVNLKPATGAAGARDDDMNTNLKPFIEAYARVRADSPESDLLGAIDTASRSLEGAVGKKTLVVIDSGLSTAGYLQCQQGALRVDPGAVVEELGKIKGALPRLSGVTVDLVGMGSTSAPQSPLNPAKVRSLEAMWEGILRASGATDVVSMGSTGTATTLTGLPPVTVVPIPAVVSVTFPTPTPQAARPGTSVAVLRDDTVAFVGDSAEFADPARAEGVLKAVAAQAVSQKLTLTVTGTAANWGTEQGRKWLSTARAEAVAAILRKHHAAVGDVIGVGIHFPEFVNDRRPDGSLDYDKAALNRSVRITVA